MRNLLIMITFLTILSGCATMKASDCQSADWAKVGEQDGNNGASATLIAKYDKSCKKAGVVPSHQAWESGRQVGLKRFCTVKTAYQRGTMGYGGMGVCQDSDNLDELIKANEYGQNIYLLQNQLYHDSLEYDRLDSVFYRPPMLLPKGVRPPPPPFVNPYRLGYLSMRMAQTQSILNSLKQNNPYQ